MITAQQARETCMNKPFYDDLEIVSLMIESQAKEGKDFTWITVKRLTDDQIETLINLGYKVDIDQSDLSIKISW